MKGNCIVYGGGGFIGSHVSEGLLEKGYGVTVFDKINFSRINIAHIENDIKIIEGDFNNEIDLKNSLENIDFVFHLISSTLPATSNDNPVYDAETNLLSSLKLFSEFISRNIKKVVFISSGGTVYGIPDKIPIPEIHPRKPICSYGIIKKTIEDYLYLYNRLYGLNYDIFRLSNPYGERQNPFHPQGLIAVFLRKIISNSDIEIWGDGTVKRDYVYIGDIVPVLIKSLEITDKSWIYNLGSGKGYTINELVKLMESVTGCKALVTYKNARKFDVPVNILDITRAGEFFGYKPSTDIKEGLAVTSEFIKKFLNEH